jgi:pilus assembly protein CpaE
MAIGLATIWQEPTLLMDMNMTSGQIALMLNKPKKRTWADLARYEEAELDIDAVRGLIGKHECGLNYILSPPTPIAAENIGYEILNAGVSLLRTEFEYVVADLPHDFSETALSVLDIADFIVLLVSPELASVYSASIALDMYKKLGYSQERIKLMVNWTFEQDGLPHKKIMNALKHPISFVLPFASTQFIGAINHGIPLLYYQPTDPVATLLEDFSFRLSKPEHQKKRPFDPSEAWQRVATRLQQSAKEKEKKKERKRWAFS